MLQPLVGRQTPNRDRDQCSSPPRRLLAPWSARYCSITLVGSDLRCIGSIRGVWPDVRCYWLACSWYPSSRERLIGLGERGGCCRIRPIGPSTSEARTRMRRLWISPLYSCLRYGFILEGERTWTGKISDNRVRWTEEGILLFRSSESWTKGGRRQGSEGRLLDATKCGRMIWLWCRVLAVSPASWWLRER